MEREGVVRAFANLDALGFPASSDPHNRRPRRLVRTLQILQIIETLVPPRSLRQGTGVVAAVAITKNKCVILEHTRGQVHQSYVRPRGLHTCQLEHMLTIFLPGLSIVNTMYRGNSVTQLTSRHQAMATRGLLTGNDILYLQTRVQETP